MGRAFSVYGKGTDVYRVLVWKPEGKRPLGRPRCSWEDNIKMDLQDVGVWTRSSWLRIGTGGECGDEPLGSIKYGEFLEWLQTG